MARYNRHLSARIRKVQELARQHYEPGNHSKSYRVVWRKFIYPVYPVCFRTFQSYVRAKPSDLSDTDN